MHVQSSPGMEFPHSGRAAAAAVVSAAAAAATGLDTIVVLSGII